MAENNQMMSVEGQLVGIPLAGPESFSQQQLDYLKRALGVDETVLYSGGSKDIKSATLSETIDNFKWIKVRMDDDHHGGRWVTVDTSNPWAKWISNFGYDYWNTSDTNFGFRELGFIASGTTITSITGCQKKVGWNSTAWVSDHQNYQYGGIVTVIGIHRIAGGNQ